MRAKRSKQYKKQLHQLHMHFGFREPYQVLVDAEFVRDANHATMDLQAALERTLRGTVKIMITQCCMRHLYNQGRQPGGQSSIEVAKEFERRRCGHRPEDFPEPLSTLECLKEVVDGKGKGENKHRYVVATQDMDVRRLLRRIPGVPLVYIKRSVMIMEPLSATTTHTTEMAELAKFRRGLRQYAGEKRKRDGDENGDEENDGSGGDEAGEDSKDGDEAARPEKKKKKHGPKQPNPLSVKKKKKAVAPQPTAKVANGDDATTKKKRKRKHKAKAVNGDDGGGDGREQPRSAEAAPAPEARVEL